MNESHSQAILVLGMHRSGTSALTGVLSMLGADPGPSLLPGMKDVNPKGFWEHTDIVAIHDQLLRSFNSSWDDIAPLPTGWWKLPIVQPFRESITKKLASDFGTSPVWLIKDPRLCRLLPLWLDILKELDCTPKFVVTMRHPMEVAQSLRSRDGMHIDHAALLWLDSICSCELHSRHYPRCFVMYEELLTDWREQAYRITSQLDIRLKLDDSNVEKDIEKFLDVSLRHHSDNIIQAAENSSIWPLAIHYYQMLEQPASNEALERETNAILWAIKDIRNKIVTANDGWYRLWSLCTELQKKEVQIDALESQIRMLQSYNERMQSTWSWRLTSPFRSALLENLVRVFSTKK